MSKIFILDFDGPILDGKLRHYQCYYDILTFYKFSPIAIEQYWQMKRAGVDRRQLLKLSDASAIYDNFLQMWLENIEDKKYLSLDKLQNNVFSILQEWKKQQVTLILATLRQNEEHLHWQLKELALLPLFDHIVVVNAKNKAVDLGKAAAIEKLLDKNQRQQALWIGDTEVDLQAARKLGMKICLLSCGLRDEDYLKNLQPDYLHKNLNDLATNIIRRPD